MNTRTQIAHATAAALRAADFSRFHALLGFDGFVDDIIDVVHERHSSDRYDRIPTLAQFGERIAATAGHGTNVELFVKRQKLGGQGPIMGNALAILGMPVTYVGAVGDGTAIHPVFNDFASRAKVISLTDAARTHALEFDDGKLMMGELASLSQITWPRVVERVGLPRLIEMCEQADLLGLLNWTMLPHATAVWRGFAEEVLPRIQKKPRVFIDLADPKKRTPAALLEAMNLLTQINQAGAPVTLGLNGAEAKQIAELLGMTFDETTAAMATSIRAKLAIDTVVIHLPASAAASTAQGQANFLGPYVPKPAILTGGGDHFNAGFALAQLLSLSPESALCLATATSGYYVKCAESPTIPQLAQFLDDLP